MRIFGVIPFVKLQNDTWTTVKPWEKTNKKNDEKWDGELSHLSIFGRYVSSARKKLSISFFIVFHHLTVV